MLFMNEEEDGEDTDFWGDLAELGKRHDSTMSGMPILIGFDESRELCANNGMHFRDIRRALRYLVPHPICGVFTDTTASIVNFKLSSKYDSSSREFLNYYEPISEEYRGVAQDIGPLFPPFILRFQDTVGLRYEDELLILSDRNFLKELRERKFSGGVSEKVKKYLSLGRPVWRDYLELGAGTGTPFILAASRKLTLLKDKDPEMTDEAAVAVISCRCPVFIPAFTPLADKLMSSHMGYCMEVDRDRSGPYLTYLSEPALACGAAHTLKLHEKAVFKFALPILKRFLPTSGLRGEFVFSVLAMRAFDKLSSYNPTALVSFDRFLSKLLGFELDDMRMAKFENYLVNLAQFVKIEATNTEITEEFVKRCACRGLGVLMGENNAGYDSLIPIITINGEMGALFFEIKNRKQKLGSTRRSGETVGPLENQLLKCIENTSFEEKFLKNSVFVLWELMKGANYVLGRTEREDMVDDVEIPKECKDLFVPELLHIVYLMKIDEVERMLAEVLVHAGKSQDIYLRELLRKYMTIKFEANAEIHSGGNMPVSSRDEVIAELEKRFDDYYLLGDEYIRKADASLLDRIKLYLNHFPSLNELHQSIFSYKSQIQCPISSILKEISEDESLN